MQLIAERSEDYMVAVFLSSYFRSPRCLQIAANISAESGFVAQILADSRLESMMLHPNIHSNAENAIRKRALMDLKGYKLNRFLFTQFPDNVAWASVALTKDEIMSVRYGRHKDWQVIEQDRSHAGMVNYLSELRNVSDDLRGKVDTVYLLSEQIQNGVALLPILVVRDTHTNELILLDGHHRLTAFMLNIETLPDEIEVLLGSSPDISQWAFY